MSYFFSIQESDQPEGKKNKGNEPVKDTDPPFPPSLTNKLNNPKKSQNFNKQNN